MDLSWTVKSSDIRGGTVSSVQLSFKIQGDFPVTCVLITFFENPVRICLFSTTENTGLKWRSIFFWKSGIDFVHMDRWAFFQSAIDTYICTTFLMFLGCFTSCRAFNHFKQQYLLNLLWWHLEGHRDVLLGNDEALRIFQIWWDSKNE